MTLNPNIDYKVIFSRLPTLINKLKKYSLFIAMFTVVGAYGFLLFQIRTFANKQPSAGNVQAKLQGLNTPTVDQALVEKIQKLEETHVEIKTLFDQARDNPFQE